MVAWSLAALKDIEELTDYLSKVNPASLPKIFSTIINQINRIEILPFGFPKQEGLSQNYRAGLVYNGKYRVHYKILSDKSIKIIRVRSTRQKPLTARDIRKADKN